MVKRIIYILSSVLLLTGSVYAATSALDEPPYSEAGPIERVEGNEIVIDDILYNIVPYAKIHANSKYPGVYVVENLTPDMIVGAKFESVDGYKSEVITELWLLDSLPPVENDD